MYQPASPAVQYSRNRLILIRALMDGISARRLERDRWEVTARSQALPYQVTRWQDMNGALHFSCNCKWGRTQGDVVIGEQGRQNVPCRHILVVRFALLPTETREAALALDTALLLAWQDGQADRAALAA